MTTTMQTPRVRIENLCTSPKTGELLPAYLVEQLDDAEAETVENHLNECPRCKEYYLLMLEVRSEAPERIAQMVENNQAKTPVAPSPGEPPGEPVETLTPSVRRKGKAKASGSLS